jgi:N-acyl-D-aspartate/D-glutamate deacylase
VIQGTIVDGTGAPSYQGEVGIDHAKIATVSKNGGLEGRERIDAHGLIIAPGFIDIHTHSDFPLLQNTRAESYVRQGVTTSILGACGRSCAPVNDATKDLLIKDVIGYDARLPVTWHSFEEYLKEFEKRGTAQNIAALVAHNAVRIAVLGYEVRAPTKSELEEMKLLVQQCMDAGAIGLSTGLAYPPGGNADTEEVVELAKVAAQHGGFYSSHLRGTDGDVLAGAEEALQIGERAKLPVHMGHFCGFFGNFEETQRGLDMIRMARDRGLDVTCDLYPYLAGANPLMAFFPPSVFNRPWNDLADDFRDSSIRGKFAKEISNSELGSFWLTKPETLRRIMLFDLYAPSNRAFKGKSLMDVAKLKGMEPVEAALSILSDEGKDMFNTGVICEWMGERDNFAVFKEPYHMVGSDGVALAPYGELASFKFHPRAYGTFPRVIARYVRERAVLALEEAVRKMTSLPAKRVGVRDRGQIKKGMWADIVVFNYNQISDRSTYEQPTLYPEGIEYVLINGEIVLRKGEHTGKLPGKILRHESNNESHA